MTDDDPPSPAALHATACSLRRMPRTSTPSATSRTTSGWRTAFRISPRTQTCNDGRYREGNRPLYRLGFEMNSPTGSSAAPATADRE
jgi:hypothetical protein